MADRPARGGASSPKGIKIAEMVGVREHAESDPVELWLHKSGRVVIRAYNECGNNYTDVDLGDLLEWARSGDGRGLIEDGRNEFSPLSPTE